MSALGVDVSHYQGDNGAPIAQVAAAGGTFVIAQATVGQTFNDPAYPTNAKRIQTAGLIGGAYHFLTGGNGASQADHFRSVIGNPDGLLCAVDVESNRLGADAEYADVKAFVKRFNQLAPGHPLFIYTANWYWGSKQFGNPDAGALNCPLWNARYTGAKGPLGSITPAANFRAGFGGWERATIVQFTSSTTIGNGRIDADLFDGPSVLLSSFTRKPVVPPPPPVIPIDQRPRYRAGFNLTLAAVTQFVNAYQVPPTPNPADDIGARAAKAAILDALDGVTLGDGS